MNSSSSWFLSSLEFSDTKVYGAGMRARLGTAAHFCKVVFLKLRASEQAELHEHTEAAGTVQPRRGEGVVPSAGPTIL